MDGIKLFYDQLGLTPGSIPELKFHSQREQKYLYNIPYQFYTIFIIVTYTPRLEYSWRALNQGISVRDTETIQEMKNHLESLGLNDIKFIQPSS